MKKIITLALTAVCFMMMTVVSAANSIDGFVFNLDGIITSYEYVDNEVLDIPNQISNVEIKQIGKGAFAYADIDTVYIANGIEIIGENAFKNSNISYVDIPESMKTVKAGAFENCGGLSYIVIGSPNIDFEKNSLKSTDRLHVTISCLMDEEYIANEILEAKGDTNFEVQIMHTALIEVTNEYDIFGDPLMYCESCGYKGNPTYDDTYMPFKDVEKSSWYYPYVFVAYSYDVINGKTNETFCPNDNLTLAEACKISAVIHSLNTDSNCLFERQPGDLWYAPYVRYCKQQGILDKNMNFEWNNKATRAEVAYFFSLCSEEADYINPDVPLTDIPDVSEKTLYSYYILDLFRKGIAIGSDANYTFYPNSYIKRSEVATLISRILKPDLRKELPKG